jgi:hypothetical protein
MLVKQPTLGKSVVPDGETPGVSTGKKGKGTTEEEACQMERVYICIFTCATTRAVLEVLKVFQSQSKGAFINAFRQFNVLRFMPRTMYSDNGAAFEAAAKYLKGIYKSKRVHDYLSQCNIV